MRGGAVIAARFQAIVEEQGRRWTVDRILEDATQAEAAIDYSRFKTGDDTVVRGAEWFLFDPASGRIREIHAYTAAPLRPDLARHELIDFDYAGRGYPVALPPEYRSKG